jgi:hypothetical protein
VARDLAVLVPSRARPANVIRLIDSFTATCRGDTQLVIGLDSDDPTVGEDWHLEFPHVEFVVESDLRFVVAWINHLAVPRAGQYRFIGTIGDDNVPRTVGWDVKVCESLERNVFCFGDDLYPGRATGTLCCHVFTRSEVVKALGYFGPPSIEHMYVDPVWMAWGQATSIEFLPDVILEHMHFSCQKSEMDATYAASDALVPADCNRYNAYCSDPNGLQADIAKIKGATPSPEEIAQFNFDLNIPERWGDTPPWSR